VYTVRFINGTTVLQTSQVAQGGNATYTGATPISPIDSSLAFLGWSPQPTNIQANTDCLAQFESAVDVSEISDSWDTIIANANAGTVSSYKLGMYKPLNLGTEGTVNMQIVGIGTDPKADNTGNAALSFVSMELLNTSHRMNPSKTAGTEGTGTLGGWEKCEMRTYLSDTVLPLVPSNVASAIKTVKKYSRIYDVSETAVDNVETEDKLWVPSSREVGTNTSQESSCPSYTAVFADSASRVKSKVGASSASDWWLRSANSAYYFRCVYSPGLGDYDNASTSYGVALGFSI
jgi:hypothetical protein